MNFCCDVDNSSIFLIILLLINVLYFIYPKYNMYYMIFGQVVGLIFFTLMIFIILSFFIEKREKSEIYEIIKSFASIIASSLVIIYFAPNILVMVSTLRSSIVL